MPPPPPPLPRAPFSPVASTSTSTLPPLAHTNLSSKWISTLSCPTLVSLTSFFQACFELVNHPEYSSSTILRADILFDSDQAEGNEVDEGCKQDILVGWKTVRRIRRKIQPSRKAFDRAMEQECLFLKRRSDGIEGEEEALLLLLPDMEELLKDGLPYYHPQVSAIAFYYIPPSSISTHFDSEPIPGSLSIDLIGLDSDPLPTTLSPNHRLSRTALILLQQLYKVSNGIEDSYEKRVFCDLLASKSEVQDLYLVLKKKYAADILIHSPRITFSWMLKFWVEDTDPKKHVFEDIAILAWLMIVWKGMYIDGKPPGGFVDVGCGNGLLVYLLTEEGFEGYGFDLRARKSWAAYKPSPKLITMSLDPVQIVESGSSPFPDNSFLIGNHADELTPWLPLLSALTPLSNFLNIPCCLHELTGKFTQLSYTIPPSFLASLPLPPSSTDTFPPSRDDYLLEPFYAPTPSATHRSGRYYYYQLYIAHITLIAGFIPEREALRIPSTKNFGFLGRKRVWEGLGEKEKAEREDKVKEDIKKLAEGVKEVWKARIPEGNAGLGQH